MKVKVGLKMQWLRIGMMVAAAAVLVGCEKDNPLKCSGPNDPVCDATPGTVCKRVSLPDMGAAAFRCLPEDGKCEQKPSVYLATTVCGADAPICGNQCANMSCSCAKCSDFTGQEDQTCATAYSGALSFCTNGSCVQCKGTGATSVGCPTTAPVCDGNSKCGPCTKHSDCSSGLCRLADYGQASAGSCVAPADIAYVGKASCMDGGAGSKAMPFCEITPALNSNRPFLVVDAGTYAGFTVSGGNRILLGKGRDAGTVINGPVIVNANAVFWMDGILLSLPAGVMNVNAALACQAGSTLTLSQSVVEGAPANIPGISATVTCGQLNVRSSHVRANGGPGILIETGRKYSIINSLISENDSGVILGTAAQGTFQFNTVLKNNMVGVDCKGQMLDSSIIVNNGNGGTGVGVAAQGLGSCTFATSHVGSMADANAGLIRADPPLFVGALRPADNYKLQAGNARNTACCVDKSDNTSVKDDYFAGARPKGTKADIGFHEVQ